MKRSELIKDHKFQDFTVVLLTFDGFLVLSLAMIG